MILGQAIHKVGEWTPANIREQRHLVPGQNIVDVSEVENAIDLLELIVLHKVR
jgi:hypothetical protein